MKPTKPLFQVDAATN